MPFPPIQANTILLFQRVQVSELRAFLVSRTQQSTFLRVFSGKRGDALRTPQARPRRTQLVWRPMLSEINSVVPVTNPAQLYKPGHKLI